MPYPTYTRRRACAILLIIIGLVAIQRYAGAQTRADAQAKDRAAINQLITNQQDSWNKGDIDAFVEPYWHSPDLTFSGATGVSRGFEGVRARYKKVYPDHSAMGKLDFSDLEFHFIGKEGALVLGHWHLTREKSSGGDIGGVFSLVWQHFPEGWRIIHDHTSAVPPSK